MASSRLVECQDCGYRWESSSNSPRCAKADCGRSRNVEPVEDNPDDLDDDPDDQLDDEDEDEEIDETTDAEMDPADDPDDEDDADDSGGYTPAFSTETTRTDTSRSTPSTSTSSTDEDDEDDEDDDGSSSTSSTDSEIPELDPEQLKPALTATFNMKAKQRGEHWKLDDDEAEQLAEGWCPVINHYAPHFMREYTELGAAVIISYTVLGPRLAKDAELKKRAEKADEDTDDSGTVRQQRVEDVADALDDEADEQTPAAAGETTDDAMGGYASV